MQNKLLLILFILISDYSLLQAQTETAAVVAEHRECCQSKSATARYPGMDKGRTGSRLRAGNDLCC